MKIFIYSDSKNSIDWIKGTHLSKWWDTQQTINQTIVDINQLNEEFDNQITLIKIPSKLSYNKIADKLAKSAITDYNKYYADNNSYNPCSNLKYREAITNVKHHMSSVLNKEWHDRKTKYTNIIYRNYPNKFPISIKKFIKKLDYTHCRIYFHLLGHRGFKFTSFRIYEFEKFQKLLYENYSHLQTMYDFEDVKNVAILGNILNNHLFTSKYKFGLCDCDNNFETLSHVVLECSKYTKPRELLIKKIRSIHDCIYPSHWDIDTLIIPWKSIGRIPFLTKKKANRIANAIIHYFINIKLF